MLKFALLASGSKGNCCVVQNQESSIVIDCGSTKKHLLASFEKIGYDYHQSDALFVTHTHKDHIAQLKMFDDVKTYAKCDLDTNHFKKLAPFEEVCINTLSIKEIPLSHDANETSGYRIESGNEVLVYITDTGYVKEEYVPLLQNADYYIFESNHDVELLMQTNRPMYVKQRIIGDKGHLCNEDSASFLAMLVGDNTKEIVLAHISEEGNTKEKAVSVLKTTLQENQIDYRHIKIRAAGQFEILLNR